MHSSNQEPTEPDAEQAWPLGHAAQHVGETNGQDGMDANTRLFLAALFTKYRPSLFRYLTGLVPTTEDAAELVQESYARLLRQTNVLRLEAVARTYLFQTATNLARDHFRRRVSHHEQQHVDVADQAIPDESSDPEQTFVWQQTVACLKQGIKELPPLTRRIFLLSRFHNKTYPQIAATLGVSTRTVERKMSEAMELLTQRVGGRS